MIYKLDENEQIMVNKIKEITCYNYGEKFHYEIEIKTLLEMMQDLLDEYTDIKYKYEELKINIREIIEGD